MEPVAIPSNVQISLATSAQPDARAHTPETLEPVNEPFVATIIKLDQAAAERLFHAARL